MYTENDEKKHLGKYIKEFKSNIRPQSDSKFKSLKEDY